MELQDFFNSFIELWTTGGFLMVPLFILGMIIYGGMSAILVDIRSYSFHEIDENRWQHLVDRPEEGEGEIGQMIRYCNAGDGSDADIRHRMAEISSHYIPAVTRRLKYSALLVSTAPLLGLLGTVMGMLQTFAGLAVSSGGDTVDRVAGGISEALITTQTGLVLAIPGYVMVHTIYRKRDSLVVFFTKLEIALLQRRHQLLRKAPIKEDYAV